MPVNRGSQTQNQKSSAPKVSFQKAAMEFGGGRWEGGIATCTKSVYAPYKYPGSDTGKHTLFTLVTWTDEAGEHHVQPYQAGFFGETEPDKIYRNAYPSKDGVYPAMPEEMDLESYLELFARLAAGTASLTPEEEEDYQGTSVVFMVPPEGERPARLPKKDWAQLVEAITTLPEFTGEDGQTTFPLTDESDCIVGYKFDLSWVGQKNKSKKADKSKTFEVLVPTASFGLDEDFQKEEKEEEEEEKPVKVKGSASKEVVKSKVKSAPAPVEEEEEEEDKEEEEQEEEEQEGEWDELVSRAESIIYKIIGEKGGTATRAHFNARAINSFKPEERVAALDLIGNLKWLTSPDRPWTFKDGKFTV